MVKRIVDKHGGTVHATSSPDSGATICFTLPTAADQPGAG
jgi:signal transduction histidine kinase